LKASDFATTVCGMSSRLSHFTIVPGSIVIVAGVNVKLSMVISTVDSGAAAGSVQATAIKATNMIVTRIMRGREDVCGSAERSGPGQRRIHDRQRRIDLRELDVGHAQVFAQLASRNGHRARRFGLAGLWLRKGRRARRVKGHVALDLLHDLMDVTV